MHSSYTPTSPGSREPRTIRTIRSLSAAHAICVQDPTSKRSRSCDFHPGTTVNVGVYQAFERTTSCCCWPFRVQCLTWCRQYPPRINSSLWSGYFRNAKDLAICKWLLMHFNGVEFHEDTPFFWLASEYSHLNRLPFSICRSGWLPKPLVAFAQKWKSSNIETIGRSVLAYRSTGER